MKQALLDSDLAKTKMMQLFTSIELLGDLKLKLVKNDFECQIQTEQSKGIQEVIKDLQEKLL